MKRELVKILLGITIGVGISSIVMSTISYLIPIMFTLAFFGVVFLLLKPSK